MRLALCALLASCRSGGTDSSPLLVEVNGRAITTADLELEAKFNSSHADKAALLEDLIDQALILEEAERRGVKLSSGELEEQIRLAMAGNDPASFDADLRRRGLGPAEWRDRVRRGALSAEAVRRILRSRISVSRQDLKDYYWEHVTQFRRPAQVRLRQIYTRTREQSEKALRELQLGEPFEEVAARYSSSLEGASGGDLGWVGKDGLPDKIAAAAFKLKKGRLSPILATRWGYHILKAEDFREGRSMRLEEAAARLHEAVLREKEQPLYRDWLFELRGRAEIKRFQSATTPTRKKP